MLLAKASGQPYDAAALAAGTTRSVADLGVLIVSIL